ncbi:MAG: ankyrin repeat domain-containing protein [Holosporales bacterium]|nr:ankyrin repeat domain-containing protein [Holosporales bacterium]
MKGFYRTTALVSLLGISNLSCGELNDARAIHETWRMGQKSLQSRGVLGNLLERSKNCFKEHPVGCVVVVVGVVVGVVGIGVLTFWGIPSLYRWCSNRAGAVAGDGDAPGDGDAGAHGAPLEAAAPADEKGKAGDAAPAPVKAAAVRISLHDAISGNQTAEDIKVLLGAGADIEATDGNGWTPLHRVVVYCGNKEVIGILLGAGAEIEARDSIEMTPLHKAVYYGNKKVIGILLGAGAEIEARDRYGKTPLDLAREKGHNDIIALLQAAEQQQA